MRNVYLHGDLGEKFGAKFRFDVATAREAGRALAVNFPGFSEYVAERRFRVVRGEPYSERGLDLGAEDIGFFELGDSDLHIIPYTGGAGGKTGGILKVVLGIVLIAVSIFVPFLQPAGFFLGASLVLSGVSQLLTPTPKRLEPPEPPDKRQSFLFSGVQNVTEQGHPVPLVFGRMMVGSVVVSAGLESGKILQTTPTADNPLGLVVKFFSDK